MTTTQNIRKSESVEAAAPLMLSVSGARGIVGQSMTPEVGWKLAAAFGNELQAATGRADPLVVVGRDSRPSSEMLAAAAVAGLLATGCRTLRLGCVMTPMAAVMIDEHGADGGVVITASHNPIEWNGLKCLNMDGVAPPAAQAARIIARYKAGEITMQTGEVMQPMLHDLTGPAVHQARVLAALGAARVELIRARKFKVVLDSVNGAGCRAGRELLESLGCRVVHLNGEPTGFFAHTPEPTQENLTELAATVKAEQAEVGFAQDPDADRLAVVDGGGVYIGEEYTLVLAAEAVLQMRSAAGGGEGRATLVTNLSTSRMMDDLVARHGCNLRRSAVGEANVVELMKAADALVGGEGNGGIIWPPVTYVRDSLSGMALILLLLAERGEALSGVVEAWPRYVFLKSKIGIRPGLAEKSLARLAEVYGDGAEGTTVDTLDGVRVDFGGSGSWLHVRASNTEPIIRILVEARTVAEAESLTAEVEALIAEV